jgi:hypothetical protein
MLITLHLDSAVESGLSLLAKQRGVSVSEYVRELVGRETAAAAGTSSSGQEKALAFLEWADSFPETPMLSDAAIRRESMYPDRW